MDPERTEDQAKALAATRRILAVMRLEAAGGEEAALTDRDRQLLAGFGPESLADDLATFAEWHRALGTDPDAALAELRERLDER
ncbi:hypothetical protein GBA65_21105 (plasmid) [Rubrobacter marinus]|uniref:Uncharacterized protein n=1 Tax=Rubrobacter marinus TaxID=2653852 RepID=A0A6G8Q3B5_9ACTN|nr:hypothetical protein [Rubrobacter marinus]QIN80962.1 hypothetical protein GBA65_21105 [Rubrobacter marinus]